MQYAGKIWRRLVLHYGGGRRNVQGLFIDERKNVVRAIECRRDKVFIVSVDAIEVVAKWFASVVEPEPKNDGPLIWFRWEKMDIDIFNRNAG